MLAGKRLLHDFVQQLRSTLRQSGILCSWGGEAYNLLLNNTARTLYRAIRAGRERVCRDR
ncbi:nucleotidyl cyclase domain-containing protein [Pseudomonas chaetocerotis]|uniref:Diguanylate cyclase n=1 Tax=Pseudomonas chaetocerotis TaxID=2758695 RepID=A0A931CZ69_9PSED|nr:diguanylate cyclase [Pseudomonas chaetocerotis]